MNKTVKKILIGLVIIIVLALVIEYFVVNKSFKSPVQTELEEIK
jgi:hypothetical protein